MVVLKVCLQKHDGTREERSGRRTGGCCSDLWQQTAGGRFVLGDLCGWCSRWSLTFTSYATLSLSWTHAGMWTKLQQSLVPNSNHLWKDKEHHGQMHIMTRVVFNTQMNVYEFVSGTVERMPKEMKHTGIISVVPVQLWHEGHDKATYDNLPLFKGTYHHNSRVPNHMTSVQDTFCAVH